MRSYLQMLIWTMFFVVMVEMIFPNSDIKKYLKFVLSFIVLYVIVAPLIECIIGTKYMPGESLENYVQYYQDYVGDEIAYSSIETERERQEKGLVELYTLQLQEQMIQLLEAQIEKIKIEDIEVDILLDNEGVVIDAIDLTVLQEEAQRIDVRIGNKNESTVLHEEQLKKEIETCLNNFYTLDSTNIYITVPMN